MQPIRVMSRPLSDDDRPFFGYLVEFRANERAMIVWDDGEIEETPLMDLKAVEQIWQPGNPVLLAAENRPRIEKKAENSVEGA